MEYIYLSGVGKRLPGFNPSWNPGFLTLTYIGHDDGHGASLWHQFGWKSRRIGIF